VAVRQFCRTGKGMAVLSSKRPDCYEWSGGIDQKPLHARKYGFEIPNITGPGNPHAAEWPAKHLLAPKCCFREVEDLAAWVHAARKLGFKVKTGPCTGISER